MEKHLLSKSTFIRAVQCEKSLYLHKKRPYLRDKLSAAQRARFARGTRVGILARDLFPGGTDMAPKSPFQYQKAVVNTRKAIEQNKNVIYEASFQYDRLLVILDVLVNHQGKLYAFEVKSSKKITKTYLQDIAFQYHVITNAGIELEDISIVHVNPDYVFSGELLPNELFVCKSLKSQVLKIQKELIDKAEAAKAVLNLEKSPAVDIGQHCFNPYDCDFIGHCWKHIKKNSVFELRHLSPKQQFEFYHNGLVYIKDLPLNALSETGEKEYRAYVQGKPYCNWNRINVFRSASKEAYYLLEIIFIRPAVPVVKNTSPYELLPAMLKVMDNNNMTVFEWEMDPENIDFERFNKILQQINASGKPLYIFNDDQDQIEFIRKRAGIKLLNIYDLFAELDYIDSRLQGNIKPFNLADTLLNENPFTLKDITDQHIAGIIMERLLEMDTRPKQKTISDKVNKYLDQFLEFEAGMVKFVNELI
ncbi:MAG: hypothetical protein R6U19_09150 [Bacteroidales bacterium]